MLHIIYFGYNAEGLLAFELGKDGPEPLPLSAFGIMSGSCDFSSPA
jgi:hypothetical protein